MNEKLQAVWNKVVEHKALVIQVGCVVVGAVIGAAITSAVINMSFNESYASDSEFMLTEEDVSLGTE